MCHKHINMNVIFESRGMNYSVIPKLTESIAIIEVEKNTMFRKCCKKWGVFAVSYK